MSRLPAPPPWAYSAAMAVANLAIWFGNDIAFFVFMAGWWVCLAMAHRWLL